jgi:NlpC/P60 family
MADNASNNPKLRSWRKRWYALWPLTALLLLYPINNSVTRTGLLAALAGIWVGLICLFWSKKIVRISALTITGILALLFLLPGRNIEVEKLRETYVQSLKIYEGTRYVWGGENRLGIDCSGLVRKGLIVANYRAGLATLNPALLREGLSLWWHDCSAKALGEDYRGRTRRLFSANSINEFDASKILPGDIAVTSNGVHTLAYLGDLTWIEADPHEQRVIQVHVPTKNAWFSEPVNLVRWSEFETTRP